MSTVFASITTPGPPGPSGRTALWIVSVGPPVTAQGLDGDMFLNSTTGDVYGPKAGVWGGVVANIKGSTGVAGPAGPAGYSPRYLVAAGPPATITGNDGDMYLNSSTNDLYGPKTAGAWGGVIANIKGATGPAGAPGAPGAPGVAYTPRGAWAAGTTYTQGDMVSDAGIAYIALQSANVGHAPLSSPTWWQAVAAGGTQTPWNSDIDGNTHILKNAGAIGVGNDLSVLPFTVASYTLVAGGSSATVGRIVVASNQGVGSNVGTFSFANYGISAAEKRICQIAGVTGGTLDSGEMAFTTWNAGVVAERMRITAAGNVGIGTGSAQAALHIIKSPGLGAVPPAGTYGGSAIIGADSALFGVYIGALASTGAGYIQAQRGDLAVTYSLLLQPNGGNVGIGTAVPSQVLHVHTGTNGNLGVRNFPTTSYAQMFSFSDDGSVYRPIHIDALPLILNHVSGGNVGIGTASPGQTLTIQPALGYAAGGGVINIKNADYNPAGPTGSSVQIGFWANSGITIPYIQAYRSAINAIYDLCLQPAGGNVGIGTTAPLHQLTVLGACVATAAINTSVGMGGTLSLDDSGGSSGSGGAVLFGANSGVFRFAAIKGMVTDGAGNSQGELAFCLRLRPTDTTLTEVMRIASSSNVGVGTTNPLNKFSIITSVLATAASANQLTIGEVSNNPDYRLSLGYFIDGSFYKGAIQSTNSGPALGTLCLQPLGGTTGIGTIAPRGTVEISSPNTGVLKNVLLLTAPRSFTPAADGLFISSTGGTLGTHDYGAIVMKTDPTTGNGGAAIVELHCGGNASLHTSASRFLAAYNGGGSSPLVNILQLHTNGTTRLQCDSSGTTIFGDCNISGSYLVGGTPITSGIANQRNVTASRVNNQPYLNDTGKPLFVVACMTVTAGQSPAAFTDSANPPTTQIAQTFSSAGSLGVMFSFWVLPGNWYRILWGAPSLSSWIEWY